jgi:hypothetical protein
LLADIVFGRSAPLKTSRRYVDCVNARDLDGLRELLSHDCRLIDARGDWIDGREDCLKALERFFALEPNYHLHIETIGRHRDEVLITGYTTADDPRFATSTAFRLRADARHLHEWQSYSAVRGPRICRLLSMDKAQMGSFL